MCLMKSHVHHSIIVPRGLIKSDFHWVEWNQIWNQKMSGINLSDSRRKKVPAEWELTPTAKPRTSSKYDLTPRRLYARNNNNLCTRNTKHFYAKYRTSMYTVMYTSFMNKCSAFIFYCCVFFHTHVQNNIK